MPSILVQAVYILRGEFLFLVKIVRVMRTYMKLLKSPEIFGAINSIFFSRAPKSQTFENQEITEISHTDTLFTQTTLILLTLSEVTEWRKHMPAF